MAEYYGFPYAAVQDGDFCLGGFNLTLATLGGTTSLCTTPCTGDGSYYCGGTSSFALYQVTLSPSTAPTPFPTIISNYGSGLSSLGCFAEDCSFNARFPELALSSQMMNLQMCAITARLAGYTTFGMQTGYQCFLGALGFGEAPGTSSACTTSCSANAFTLQSDICGYVWPVIL